MNTHFWKLLSNNIFTYTYICAAVFNVKRWKIFIFQQSKNKPTPPSFDRSRKTSTWVDGLTMGEASIMVFIT